MYNPHLHYKHSAIAMFLLIYNNLACLDGAYDIIDGHFFGQQNPGTKSKQPEQTITYWELASLARNKDELDSYFEVRGSPFSNITFKKFCSYQSCALASVRR